MPLLKDGTYSVRLFDDAGPHRSQSACRTASRCSPTSRRRWNCSSRPRESSAPPGSDVPVTIRAGDDHGIRPAAVGDEGRATRTAARGHRRSASRGLQTRRAGHGRQAVERLAATPPTTAVRHHLLKLKPDDGQAGPDRAHAGRGWDRREVNHGGSTLRPQESQSGWHAVKIVGRKSQSAAALEQLESSAGAIWKILEQQIHARSGHAGPRNRPQWAPADRRGRRNPRRAGRNSEDRGRVGRVDRPGRKPERDRPSSGV